MFFLYDQVLDKPLKNRGISAFRAKQKSRMPVVRSQEEVQTILFHSSGPYKLMLMLLYGCGLRMNELLRLRIKDIDIRSIQELLGHKNLQTTMIYTRVVRSLSEKRLISPLDSWE